MSTSIERPVPAPWRWFFLVAALYDIGLGLVFLVGGEPVFEAIGMELPPHVSYIQLAAVFVTVQGLSYLFAMAGPHGRTWASSGSAWPTRRS